MNLIERLVTGLCRAVLWASTLVIFVILVCNTALRYASGASLQWANEVPELLFPWLVMSGVVLAAAHGAHIRSEEHTSELQSQSNLVCRLLLEKKKNQN